MAGTSFHEAKEGNPLNLAMESSPVVRHSRNKAKKIILEFGRWLIDQQHREDLIGDFARLPSIHAVEHKTSRRKIDEHKSWTDIVIRITEPGYIVVFNEAWQEFLLAKQIASDSAD